MPERSHQWPNYSETNNLQCWRKIAHQIIEQWATQMPLSLRSTFVNLAIETWIPSDIFKFTNAVLWTNNAIEKKEEFFINEKAIYWEWPELKNHLNENQQTVEELLLIKSRTTFGNRDVNDWKNQIMAQPASYWLDFVAMKNLRVIQKNHKLGSAKKKSDLIELLLANVAGDDESLTKLVKQAQQESLIYVENEIMARQQPFAEKYKDHLIVLIQNRLDAWHIFYDGDGSPTTIKKQKHQNLMNSAYQSFNQSKTIDIVRYQQNLEYQFFNQIGQEWKNQPAALKVYNSLIEKARWNIAATLEQWIEFWKKYNDLFHLINSTRLELKSICRVCQKQDRSKELSLSIDCLPPYHVGCLCGPLIWKIDVVTTKSESSESSLNSETVDYIESIMKMGEGISVHVPTLKELVTIVDIEMKSKPALSLLKRLQTFFTQSR